MVHGRSSERRSDALARRKYLTFFVASEEYGVEIGVVQEIVGLLPITPLPNVPAYCVGVVSLRGMVIPVLDVRRRLDITPHAEPRGDIVVIRHGTLRVGLLVDRVAEVAELALDAIEPAMGLGLATVSQLVDGLVTTNGRVRILLDAAALVGEELAPSPRSSAA